MLENINNEVSQEFEEIRSRNKLMHESREREILSKIPEFESIYDEISSMGIRLLKASIALSDNEIEEISQTFKARTEFLKKRKAEILAENGYPTNYLDEIYACPICKDSGIDGSKKCICYTKRLINAVYKASNLNNRLNDENFSTFNTDYYSKTVQDGNISPYENIVILKQFALDFVSNFPNEHNILIYGPVGTGKTFMCNCVAKALLDKGYTVLYLSAFQLCQLIKYDTFEKDDKEKSNPILELITTADLLIIDDFGTETANVIFDSTLFNYLNIRQSFGKSTVISSNLSIKEIKQRYSERISSRILGTFKLMRVFGSDIRILKKKNANK